MSATFEEYAEYYDLLYKDKNYAEESQYVSSLLQESEKRKTILELGSGTGGHAEHLARAGYSVDGVDISEDMVRRALLRKEALSADVGERLSFARGDVRKVRKQRTYDAVISLFHVMSYQASNADLAAALETAAVHLAPDGVFVFDFWYGPAVLRQEPQVRVRELESDRIKVTRIARPVIRENDNLVDVNYEVLVEDKQTQRLKRIRETHVMRYLFLPEIDFLLAKAGLRRRLSKEWLSEDEPSFDSWSVVVLAEANGS